MDERKVKRIYHPPTVPAADLFKGGKQRRVAAYARVSTASDEQLNSVEAQKDYFAKLIRQRPDWIFVDVYADEGITGTSINRREAFNRMVADALAGNIDLIVTKSISRFARNTVDTLNTIHQLKSANVEVFFEKENIYTMDSKGEFLITLLSSIAEEESRSISENVKWGQRKRFADGKYSVPYKHFLGYRKGIDGIMEIVPEEAEVVRSIYADFLDGKGVTAIIKRLNSEGILTQQGFRWHKSAITRVLKNYTYTGNLLLQTKYRENHLTKRTLVNHGQLPQYHATDTHEPIIDIGTYNSVQLEMYRRTQKYGKPQTSGKYPFSGMITCALCGKHYRRKVTATGPVWICSTYNTHDKAACPSKAIPESTLMEIATMVSATGEITAVTAHNDNTLEFTLADGTVTVKQWQDRSRAASWTPEMRVAAGEKSRERKRQYA